MNRIVLILLLVSVSLKSFGQMPGKDQISTGLWDWEMYGGLTIASNGWGANIQYAKYQSLKYRHVVGLRFTNIKHYKEYKTFNYFLEDASGYYYGKINSVLAFRPYYGGKRTVFEKTRDKGVEISWIWGVGINLSMIKPVYLKIRKFNAGGPVTTQEPYDPDQHPIETIVGRASIWKGFNELSFGMGVFAKTGAFFDITARKARIFGIEVGVHLDTYFNRVPIMNIEKNEFMYPGVYLNVLFGKKHEKYGVE